MALPRYEDWQAPWEKKGEDFDAETARKFIYNVLSDRQQLETDLATVTGDRDTFKAKAEEAELKDLDEVERLRRELEQAKSSPPQDPQLVLENTRLRLAIDHGLTVKQAARLRGSTPEELEADVGELKELIGAGAKVPPTSQPRGDFRTGNEDGGPDDDLSLEKAASYF